MGRLKWRDPTKPRATPMYTRSPYQNSELLRPPLQFRLHTLNLSNV